MSCSRIFGLLAVWFALLLAAGWASAREYRPLPLAPHLHSRFSDGAHRVSRVAAMARDAGYQGIWMTDHTDVAWALPVTGGITVGYHRNSLRETGFHDYLAACRVVQRRFPELVVLAGVEASPYYFWSREGERLVNHQWMKHLVVAGIEDARLLRRLPMTAYHNSPFPPGFTDHGEAPYQAFTRAVHEAGGMAFWAHPWVRQDRRMVRNVYARVTPYAESLLTVPFSSGFAAHRWDEPLIRPGGIWDAALAEYCAGTRPVAPRVMTEIDYHRGPFAASATLGLLVPSDLPDDAGARKRAVLDAMQAGRFYATTAAPAALRLDDFSAMTVRGEAAVMGQSVAADAPVVLSYSLTAENPVEWVYLIRNGVVVHRSADLAGRWTDEAAARADAPGYYRLAVKGQGRAFLLANPIYYQPVAP